MFTEPKERRSRTMSRPTCLAAVLVVIAAGLFEPSGRFAKADEPLQEITASRDLAAPWNGSVYAPTPQHSQDRKIHPALFQQLHNGERLGSAWIFFTDKGATTQQDYLVAIAELAATYNTRAIERRMLRRTAPGLFDEYDLPVLQEYVDAITDTGAKRRVTSKWLNAVSVRASGEQLTTIAEFPFVRSIEPVRQGEYALPQSDTELLRGNDDPQSASGFYGLAEPQVTQINLDAMHDKGFTGAGVIIGVLDTGFKRSHIAFNHPDHPIDVIAEWDFFNDDPNTDVEPGDRSDQHHHGTWILGTIAAYQPNSFVGCAYDASFILAKVEDAGSEYPLEEDWFTAGLEFIEAGGGDVATSSLAAFWYDQSDMDGETSVMAQAFNIATANGLHCTQGAGNSGHDDDPNTAHLITPGDAFDVITVGAVDVNSDIAWFSSDGPTQDGRVKPEVLTRGEDTWTVSEVNDNTYRTQNGTSLATPLAASAVACLVQAHPEWTVQQMRQHLFTTADYYVANKTYDPLYVLGYGIIDADAANESSIRIIHGNPDWDRNDSDTWISFNQWAFGGYIDPKIESTDGTNLDLGLNTFNIVFNTEPFGDAAGGPITLANVSIEETGPGPAPGAVSIVKSGDTITVQLDRIITLQEWTTLVVDVYNANGARIVDNGNEGEEMDEPARLDVGFLVADVNNDGAVQPLDLARWIHAWKQGIIHPPDVEKGHPNDYLDISRSGGPQPQDLTRLIQLLKDRWMGEQMNNLRP